MCIRRNIALECTPSCKRKGRDFFRRPALRLLNPSAWPRIPLSAGRRRLNLPALYRMCQPRVKANWRKPRHLTFCRREMLWMHKSPFLRPKRPNPGVPSCCTIRFPRLRLSANQSSSAAKGTASPLIIRRSDTDAAQMIACWRSSKKTVRSHIFFHSFLV